MNSHPSEDGGAAALGGQEPVPLPPSLSILHVYVGQLWEMLEVTAIAPQKLDVQASKVHENMVVPAYKLMCAEVAKACAERWSELEQRRFRGIYNDAADNWSVYEVGLEELELIRKQGTSRLDAMKGLKQPRRDYLNALNAFYEAFSATLYTFFTPPPKTV